MRTRCGDKARALPQLTEGGREFQKGEREGGREESRKGRKSRQSSLTLRPDSIAQSHFPLLAPWDWTRC